MTYRIVPLAAAAFAITDVAFAQTLGMQPGEWEIVSTTTAVDMPGAPPTIANMLRGKTTTIRQCVTPQDVAKGPQAAMKQNTSCTIVYHSGLGGRFTSQMVCKPRDGVMTVNNSGTLSQTSFSSTSKLMMSGKRAMTMSSTVTGRKVGECKR